MNEIDGLMIAISLFLFVCFVVIECNSEWDKRFHEEGETGFRTALGDTNKKAGNKS